MNNATIGQGSTTASKPLSTASSDSKPEADCNYSNNYYGDQACTACK